MEKKRISESDSKTREIIKDEREKRQFLSFSFGWEIERCVVECRLRRAHFTSEERRKRRRRRKTTLFPLSKSEEVENCKGPLMGLLPFPPPSRGKNKKCIFRAREKSRNANTPLILMGVTVHVFFKVLYISPCCNFFSRALFLAKEKRVLKIETFFSFSSSEMLYLIPPLTLSPLFSRARHRRYNVHTPTHLPASLFFGGGSL